jgi:hypothetical protein
MEWAEETIVRLRTLWDEGLSTAEIGRRLGVSKNAVVGKAHRLDLPARPSPIQHLAIEWPGVFATGPAASGCHVGQASSRAASGSCGAPGAAAIWSRCHVLLAAWRARHQKLPVLRRPLGAGQAVLLGPREACLCKGARPPRRRCLTTIHRLPVGLPAASPPSAGRASRAVQAG